MNGRFSCILFVVLLVLLDGLGAVARGAEEGTYVILVDEGNGYCYRADPRGTIQQAFGEGKLQGYSDLDVSPDGELLSFLSFEEGRSGPTAPRGS